MQSSPRSQRFVRTHTSPGFRRTPHLPIHPFILLLILVVIFASLALGGYYTLSAKTVELVINGAQHEARTHQTTVAALLNELQVGIRPQDKVSPVGNTLIQNGLTVTIDQAQTVIVDVDGSIRNVLTRHVQPREILDEAGIQVGPNDEILVDGDSLRNTPYATAPSVIQVIRAIHIVVNDQGATSTISTVHRTAGEALHSSGIKLYLADKVSPDLGAAINDGSTITIERSIPITIVVDGQTFSTRTHDKTIEAALAESGIALVGLDYSTPDAGTPIQPNMAIRVVRVSEDDDVQRSDIEFKQVMQSDPTLPMDTRQVIQTGIKGVLEERVHIRREDGVEVSRSAPVEVVVQNPRDEIVAIGTLPQLKTMDTPSGQIQYWRVLKMRAASYMPSSSGKASDDPTYGLTATGKQLHKGIVAVDPKLIPLGTALYIPGYGLATAEDTGGLVQGLVIDLGYSDDDYQPWSGTVDVYLLAPAPSPDQVPLLPTEETP